MNQSKTLCLSLPQCLNLTELLHHYGLSSDSLISPVQFTYLCPALLYQIDRRFCILHYHHVEAEVQDETSSGTSGPALV